MKITFENVTKKWGEITTLDDVNFTINDGEFLAILGPSGCGKSTTLMLIAGLYRPNDGRVLFDDACVNDVESKDRNVGVVFQSYALYPYMSILENIMFPLQFKRPKIGKEEAKERAIKAAQLLEVDNLLDRRPSELSGGQQQRVALARGIVKEPALLLLDEPLSNLDATLRLNVRSELRNIHRKLKITTVLVTHDQVEAITLADRIICMNNGSIAQIGTADELYNKPNSIFVAKFIGSPPINILNAHIKNRDLYIQSSLAGKVDLAADKDNKDYFIGIRPEHIVLNPEEGGIKYQGKIIDLESLGRESLYIVQSDFGSFNVLKAEDEMVGGQSQYQIGEVVHFNFMEKRVFLFDKESEKNIACLTL